MTVTRFIELRTFEAFTLTESRLLDPYVHEVMFGKCAQIPSHGKKPQNNPDSGGRTAAADE